MRIAFLLHQGNMYSGGQGVYLAALCREYLELGHDVEAFVGPPYPELPDGVVEHRLEDYSVFHLLDEGRAFWRRPAGRFFEPVNFYELATSKAGMFSVMAAFSLRAFGAVARRHRERPFDIVHDNQSLGYGDLLLRRLGLPVVANVHHPLVIDRANAIHEAASLREQVGRVLFYPLHMQGVVARRLDRIVTGSAASAGSVARALRVRPERIAAIHDGVDTSRFYPGEEAREPGRILFVGNSDDRNKGARYLVEALARVEASWELVVVDRAEARVVQEAAARLGVGEQVTLTGRLTVEELRREYSRAALFLCPSLYEGFGLPAAEAQACGAPVVATSAGALPEVVRDGETGVLVPPGDAGALASAIARLLADDGERGRLGTNGPRHVAERLTWRRTAERTLALYEDVLEARGHQRQRGQDAYETSGDSR